MERERPVVEDEPVPLIEDVQEASAVEAGETVVEGELSGELRQ